MKIGVMKKVDVEARTLSIHTKVAGMFQAVILDQDGEEIGGQEDGCVPDLMPGEHYGDYIILEIDIDTGQIKNWKTPSADQIESFVNGEEE